MYTTAIQEFAELSAYISRLILGNHQLFRLVFNFEIFCLFFVALCAI